MWIGEKPTKKSMEFDKIREGTVFTCEGKVYLKGTGGAAVDLETGNIIYPANDTNHSMWNTCLIYPRASVNLYRNGGDKGMRQV